MYIIFVASLNENMKLAKQIQKNLQEKGQENQIINLVELNLPMYDSKKEEKDGIPKVINSIREQMRAARGYIIVSPEYNYSIPPVLSNFIAWISRSNENFREVFTLKPIQVAIHAGSGGNDVANAIRFQLTKLGAIVLPREIIATYTNPVKEDSMQRILKQFLEISKEK